MRRLKWPVLAGAILALAVPGQAQAAVTIGETFAPNSANPANPCPADRTFLQTSSPGGLYAAPSAGVITAWSFHANESPPSVELKVGRQTAPNTFQIVGESGVKSPVPNQLNTYTDVRISVLAGDVIGLYTATAGDCAVQRAGFEYHFRVGDLPPGPPLDFAEGDPPIQLDVSARLEPDCDNDGFGDETQDTDTASCTALCQKATVNKIDGTEGDDNLVGSINSDAIFGLGGNDELDGVDGNDCVDGGDGDDRVSGGADDDIVKGGDGRDKVRGLGGRDRLKGQGGVDRVNGGEGADKLSGGPGADKMRGAAAKDRYKGNAGDDDINAVDAKRDRVNCGGGDDKAVVDPVDRVSANCETVREVEKD